MSRDKPTLIPNQHYHIYNRAIAGHLLFRDDHNYEYFLSRIHKYLLESSILRAYCLMPNHYHLIVEVTDDEFPGAMHKLALSYVVSFNRVYDHRGHLFQGTYQRKLITDLSYLLHLSRYVHLNPVKAKLAGKAELWDYSSYQEYIGMKSINFLDPFPILDLLSDNPHEDLPAKQKAYQKFVEQWDFNYMEFKIRD